MERVLKGSIGEAAVFGVESYCLVLRVEYSLNLFTVCFGFVSVYLRGCVHS